MDKKNILITGASGFVGSRLFRAIQNHRSFSSFAVYRNKAKCDSVPHSIHITDINAETDWLNNLPSKIDCVVHTAGVAHVLNGKTFEGDLNNAFLEVNVKGTLNLAKQLAKQGLKRFIFISSIGVHGNATTGDPITEFSPLEPHNEYAKSKLDAEQGLKELSRELGFELVIIRPVLIYALSAPGNCGKLVKLIGRFPVLPFGSCNNARSMISVNNLIDFIILCCYRPEAANEDFVIADDLGVSTKQICDAIAKGLGKKVYELPIPMALFRMIGILAKKEQKINQLIGDLQVDASKAKKLLGWSPNEKLHEGMLE
ncbi:NAD-dependent epimerase/dehydratase family protein [Neptuniibacter sp. QD29_5]|uniref:NAD-dependent epimerase/dehydratase family protein n=1 Tax=Neptuniibacter sp. QD29_5 TaxID=3398207 RepID=UPI0039F4CB1C